MFPSLVDGDRLTYRRQRVYCPGDIIAYEDPRTRERHIIHRIVRVDPQGYITAGDNNNGPDSYIVTQAHIVGRIVKRTRGSCPSVIWGGKVGLLCHGYFRHGRPTLRRVYRSVEPMYDALARRVSPLFSSLFVLQPVLVTSRPTAPSRPRALLFVGRWCVGWWSQDHWHVRPEFRLLVDTTGLPSFERMVQEVGGPS
jgi:hypothetical protein